MPFLQHIQHRLRRDATSAELSALRALRGGDAVRGYGWIRLPFGGGGDRQEISYPLDCRARHREEHDLRVDVLQIDTEGYESAVLAGAQKMLARDRPTVCIELSQEYADSSRESIRRLRDLGYAFDREPDLSQAHNGDNFLLTHPERGD